jgi:hypothetical protein
MPPYRPHATAEYFFVDFDDVPDNVRSQTVEACFLPPRTDPTSGDWSAASWDPTRQATAVFWYDGTLAAGWWKMWTRTNGTIVREHGTIRLV